MTKRGMKNRHLFYVYLSLLAVAVLAALAIPAKAHDWYPLECCHAMDCAPVERHGFIRPMSGDGLPQLMVTSKHGTVTVPHNFPRRTSKDGRMHVCMRPGTDGSMRLLCIFYPPSF
jgi:hypothetical protein